MTTFELEEGRVLRPFRIEDADAVFAAVKANYDHLRDFMDWMVPDYSIGHAREFISASIGNAAKEESLGLGIFEGSTVIGSIGFVNFDHKARRTELGYWIDRSLEGQGIVTRACRVLIGYAFEDLHMNRIEIRCSTENVRSAAVPVRLGFRREGVLRQSEWRNGRLHDFALFGLLASEWEGNFS